MDLELSQVLAMIFGTAFAMTCITAPLWMQIIHDRKKRKDNGS